MSNSTTQPGTGHMTILAGATFRELWQRSVVPYETMDVNGVLCKLDGTPVPESDYQPEDYTDCTAVAELRDSDSGVLLGTFSTSVTDHYPALRAAIREGFAQWIDALTSALARARDAGEIAADCDPADLAAASASGDGLAFVTASGVR